MIAILTFVLAFVLLDIAALRWGSDTTEGIDSCEWYRREHWGEKASEQVTTY